MSVLPLVLSYALVALFLFGCAVAVQPAKQTNTPAPSPSPEASLVQAQQQPSDKIDRSTSKPYTGSLSIFEDPKRAQRLQVDRVMDVLGIKEGTHVADIGAGSGWFTVRAAQRVGTGGVVYAVEINEKYLDHIAKRAQTEGFENIRTVLGKEDDPLLPPQTIDAVLLLKTYHEVAEPIRFLRRIREAMKDGALLGIIDRNGKAVNHGVDQKIVIEEAQRAGFALESRHDFVKRDNVDYFLVFRRQEEKTN